MERIRLRRAAGDADPPRSPWVLSVCLVLLLIPSCGETKPEGAADPITEETVTEDTVARMEAEIAALERASEPARGTSRSDIERRYGEGRPVVTSKVPVEVPPDSRQRVYEFLPPHAPGDRPDAVLSVRYDHEWRVRYAHFQNPYSIKSRIAGVPIPLVERHHEARKRLPQMRRIREELRRRFGE